MTQADRECTKARCPLNRKCQGEVHTSCLQGLLKICASLRWPGHLNGDRRSPAGLRSPSRAELCAAAAEAAAVFDEAAVWGHIGAGKIHSGRAPRRKKIKGGHER